MLIFKAGMWSVSTWLRSSHCSRVVMERSGADRISFGAVSCCSCGVKLGAEQYLAAPWERSGALLERISFLLPRNGGGSVAEQLGSGAVSCCSMGVECSGTVMERSSILLLPRSGAVRERNSILLLHGS